MEKKTGARGLRAIVEQVMLEIMFGLPDQPAGSRYVVTAEVVRGERPLFAMPSTKTA